MRTVVGLALLVCLAAPAVADQKACGNRTSVRYGETVTSLAQRCGINVEALKQANPGMNVQGTQHGTFITVPSPSLPSPTVGGGGSGIGIR